LTSEIEGPYHADVKRKLILLGFALVPTFALMCEASEMNWLSVKNTDWKVRTDKTERPDVGLSTLEFTNNGSLKADGLLYSIAGKNGPVGFALVEAGAEVDGSAYETLCFEFGGTPAGAHFQVLLKDDQSNQPNGTLTFQHDFVATSEKRSHCFALSEFAPTIRGAAAPGFILNRTSLRYFSLQISRSSQVEPLLSISPIKFTFSLSGVIQFR
jgi:hypothetical protein